MRSLTLTLALAAGCLAQEVRLTFVGQSCFVVEGGGAAVMTDPSAPSTGYPMPARKIDVVTVSHNHSDHNYTAGVAAGFELVDGRQAAARGEITAAGLPFVLLPGWHDDQEGRARGANAIIVWRQAGLTIAHLGDHGQERLWDEQAAELRGVDVLFVPAGGFYTIDAERAAALVAQIRPRLAILMHFRTALGGPAQLAQIPQVAAAFPDAAYKPASAAVRPQDAGVWIMEPAGEVAAVNAASYASVVAPGSIASAFGDFQGRELLVGGKRVAELMASPKQVNFVAPADLTPGQYALSPRGVLTVAPAAPGIFAAAGPARRGEPLTIYATGMGLLRDEPGVFFAGLRAQVLSSSVTPGGLWLITVAVPPNAPREPDLPLVIQHGLLSNVIPLRID
ncbi:MAG: MBL fold metallo-hydrolase [Bryobacteraceae bacterium]